MVCKRVAVAAAVGLVSGLLAHAVDAQVDDDDYWNDDEPAVENKKTDEKKLLIAVIVGGGSIIALLAVVVYIYTAPAKESIVLYSPASHNGHSFARHHRIRQSGRTAASWLGKSFYQRDSNSTFSSDHSNSIVQGKKPILPRDITNQSRISQGLGKNRRPSNIWDTILESEAGEPGTRMSVRDPIWDANDAGPPALDGGLATTHALSEAASENADEYSSKLEAPAVSSFEV